MSANIFISFAAQDRKVAMTLCAALESRGFPCWISARDILPGENFQVAIVRAIRRAKMMLLVFTANSNNSEEMTKELALASQQKLIVVPLRVEDVKPNEAFSYEFATRQWIDFFADWESSINQLIERIETAIPPEPVATTPVATTPAAPEPPAARAAATRPTATRAAATRAAAPLSEPPPAAREVAPTEAVEPVLDSADPPQDVTLRTSAAAALADSVEAQADVEELSPPDEAMAAPETLSEPETEFEPISEFLAGSQSAVSEMPAFRPLEGEAAGADVAAFAAEPAAKPRSRVGIMAAAAVIVLLIVGLGFAVPALMGKKSEATVGASAATEPTPHMTSLAASGPVSPTAASETATDGASPATSAAATAASTLATTPAAGVSASAVDPNAPPAPKPVRQRKAPRPTVQHTVRSDVPY